MFIFNRREDSQAGRREFDPRLPLFVFSDLGTIGVFNVTAITAFSPDPHGRTQAGGVLRASLRPPSKFLAVNCFEKSHLEHSPPLIDYSRFQLTDRSQPVFQAGNGILVFVHVHGVAHLSRAYARQSQHAWTMSRTSDASLENSPIRARPSPVSVA